MTNTNQPDIEDSTAAEADKMELYKEEVTDRGAMKIEVVLEEAKKKKKERPGSATSIRSMEDIERRQQVKFFILLVDKLYFN